MTIKKFDVSLGDRGWENFSAILDLDKNLITVIEAPDAPFDSWIHKTYQYKIENDLNVKVRLYDKRIYDYMKEKCEIDVEEALVRRNDITNRSTFISNLSNSYIERLSTECNWSQLNSDWMITCIFHGKKELPIFFENLRLSLKTKKKDFEFISKFIESNYNIKINTENKYRVKLIDLNEEKYFEIENSIKNLNLSLDLEKYLYFIAYEDTANRILKGGVNCFYSEVWTDDILNKTIEEALNKIFYCPPNYYDSKILNAEKINKHCENNEGLYYLDGKFLKTFIKNHFQNVLPKMNVSDSDIYIDKIYSFISELDGALGDFVRLAYHPNELWPNCSSLDDLSTLLGIYLEISSLRCDYFDYIFISTYLASEWNGFCRELPAINKSLTFFDRVFNSYKLEKIRRMTLALENLSVLGCSRVMSFSQLSEEIKQAKANECFVHQSVIALVDYRISSGSTLINVSNDVLLPQQIGMKFLSSCQKTL